MKELQDYDARGQLLTFSAQELYPPSLPCISQPGIDDWNRPGAVAFSQFRPDEGWVFFTIVDAESECERISEK